MALEKCLEQRGLCLVRNTHPGQGQAPGFTGITADVLTLSQFSQRTNTLRARITAAGQMFGKKQGNVDIIWTLTHKPLKTVARLTPVAFGKRQVVIELSPNQTLRRFAGQCLTIDGNSLLALTVIHQQTRLL